MLQRVASDQGLHCLLTECSNNPQNGNRLVHLIRMGNSIQLKWVKLILSLVGYIMGRVCNLIVFVLSFY